MSSTLTGHLEIEGNWTSHSDVIIMKTVSGTVGTCSVNTLTEGPTASDAACSWWLPSQHLYPSLSGSWPCFQLLSTCRKATGTLNAQSYNGTTASSSQTGPSSVSSAWPSQTHASQLSSILSLSSLPRWSEYTVCLQVLSSFPALK